ncbi:hypothetical protein NBRC3255_1094 [Gluconobacter thailandicus NBRC 3255]|nr:hypothetical protein NBRC3255_1094 [Gluconobacter thailandicus NBRC 3255]
MPANDGTAIQRRYDLPGLSAENPLDSGTLPELRSRTSFRAASD